MPPTLTSWQKTAHIFKDFLHKIVISEYQEKLTETVTSFRIDIATFVSPTKYTKDQNAQPVYTVKASFARNPSEQCFVMLVISVL